MSGLVIMIISSPLALWHLDVELLYVPWYLASKIVICIDRYRGYRNDEPLSGWDRVEEEGRECTQGWSYILLDR